jgi:acetylornithine deacetylase/succinyl-diaminopimelate desuccinylase-like protein
MRTRFADEALDVLARYLEMPCLSPAYDPEWASGGHIDRAVEFLADWARSRPIEGIRTDIHRLEGRTPLLVCEIPASDPEAGGTVVLYGHFDKQPPLGTWSPGLDPFRPVLRANRLYGRGSADDGYSLFAALLAVESVEKAGLRHPRCVVLIEGSEESASPDLDAHLDALAARLEGTDLLVCLDSGAPTYDRLWLTQSLRGNAVVTVDVRVLERGVHSGTASGIVPSPFRVLRQLLSRVEDPDTGEVLLPSLSAEPPPEQLRRLQDLADELGDVVAESLPVLEGVELAGAGPADRLLRQAWRPAMSVIGIDGIPSVSAGGNVVYAATTANLSFRLPPSVDAVGATASLVAALGDDPPSGAKVTVTAHPPASGWSCPRLAPWLLEALDEASTSAFGRKAGWTSEGGSIPFLATLGKRFPGVQVVATGVLGPGSNAHSIDESLHIPAADSVTLAVAHLLASHAEMTRGLPATQCASPERARFGH